MRSIWRRKESINDF